MFLFSVNLALGKHASISSRAHFWSRPELANDGDGGQVDTKCTQTVGNDTEAWWQVDLQGASILSIQITYADNSKYIVMTIIIIKIISNIYFLVLKKCN